MRLGLVVIALAGAGCDVVFSLDCEGHDEDGDGVPDVCDNCPGIANADQANELDANVAGGGDDLVGDVCDPNPTLAGDEIALFISFASPNENALWRPVTTNNGWSFDGEDLVFVPNDTSRSELLALRTQPARPLVADFGIAIDSNYIMSSQLELSVDADYDADDATRRGVTCGLSRFLANDMVPRDGPLAGWGAGLVDNGRASPLPAEVVAGDRFRVRVIDDPALVRCGVTPDGGEVETTTEMSIDPQPLGVDFAIAASNVTARIEYLVIYKTSTPRI